ncbi:MAG: 16S rRNA (guanine1516-N2)-methyltransferase [Paracoccaceae bacterium]|jgi:16S rRNA (guanine1516-N2)-methyltransferase
MAKKKLTPNVETLMCNFVSGAVLHRLRFGGGRGQDLPKAVGMRGGKTPEIVDATAGLGRDAFLLASLGAKVTLIERSEQMHRLLKQGLDEAYKAGGDIAQIVSRMVLIYGDSKDLIPKLSPQVILVDPMHPPRKKTALVGKEMRLVRKIVGSDDDYTELLEVALDHASNRVVLKLPRYAEVIGDVRLCSHQILGKSTRYDVYMNND